MRAYWAVAKLAALETNAMYNTMGDLDDSDDMEDDDFNDDDFDNDDDGGVEDDEDV